MTPQQRYQQDLSYNEVQPDPLQAQVVDCMQRIYDELLHSQKQQKKWLYRLAIFCKLKKPIRVKGLYLWGSVGIGKTYLMDLFYQSITFSSKKRLHFHDFMQKIHEQMRQYRNLSNPLHRIAKAWAQQINVLCLDEFMVMEITDAMILARLLEAFFQHGIVLLTTSNVEPKQLYTNGLQRELFLPTITLLENHTNVFHLASHFDYRCMNLQKQGVYFYPINENNAIKMRQLYKQLTSEKENNQQSLIIYNRPVKVRHCASDIVWFDFAILCHVPRSQQDYLFIAKRFRTLFLSDVPEIQAHQDDLITYFIHLIDICYDRKVKLVINAAVPIDQLYTKGRLIERFKRTHSRLMEMQTEHYLHAEHLNID